MKGIEKTVFISYRRKNAPWALAIFQDLTHHGYDVFFDFNGIASGELRARHTRKHQGTCAFPRRAHSVSVGAL
jgi:hypothetical protein